MKTRLAAALALAVVLLPSATAAPERQAKYAVRDLGTLGGTVTAAADVNAMGQVVGFSMTGDGFLHAFVWDRGVMTDLGTLGGESSYATAINDSGWVVGFSQISHSRSSHAFLWRKGVGMKDLGTLGGDQSFAADINNAGLVVGRAFDASAQSARVRMDGGRGDARSERRRSVQPGDRDGSRHEGARRRLGRPPARPRPLAHYGHAVLRFHPPPRIQPGAGRRDRRAQRRRRLGLDVDRARARLLPQLGGHDARAARRRTSRTARPPRSATRCASSAPPTTIRSSSPRPGSRGRRRRRPASSSSSSRRGGVDVRIRDLGQRSRP